MTRLMLSIGTWKVSACSTATSDVSSVVGREVPIRWTAVGSIVWIILSKLSNSAVLTEVVISLGREWVWSLMWAAVPLRGRVEVWFDGHAVVVGHSTVHCRVARTRAASVL